MEHVTREELLRRLTAGTRQEAMDAAAELVRREDSFEGGQTLQSLLDLAAQSEAAANALRSLLPLLERRLVEAGGTPASTKVADALIALAPDEALERFKRLLVVPGPHREALASALGRLGKGAAPLRKELSREPPLRFAILRGLYMLPAPDEEALTLVVECLSHAPRIERLRALAILEHWGSQAASALPTLRPLLEDEDPFIRLAARDAWKALAQEELPPLPSVDPESWEGLYARWVEARFRGQTALYVQLERQGHHRLARGTPEDWEWMREALAHRHKRWLVVPLLDNAPLPRRLLRPMLAAAIQEDRSPGRSRVFVRPCVETYGVERVRELLTEYLTTGSPEERERAKQVLSWCTSSSGVKRGLPSNHPHRSKS